MTTFGRLNPVSTAKVYDAYGVDELMFVDGDATNHGRQVNGKIIEEFQKKFLCHLL